MSTKAAKILGRIYKKGKYKSKSDFARKLNIQQPTLHVWMSGDRDPSFESIERLVKNLKKIGFDISRDALR